jgi:hypothetical protein
MPHLKGPDSLRVIKDIMEQPAKLRDDEQVAAVALVKKL